MESHYQSPACNERSLYNDEIKEETLVFSKKQDLPDLTIMPSHPKDSARTVKGAAVLQYRYKLIKEEFKKTFPLSSYQIVASKILKIASILFWSNFIYKIIDELYFYATGGSNLIDLLSIDFITVSFTIFNIASIGLGALIRYTKQVAWLVRYMWPLIPLLYFSTLSFESLMGMVIAILLYGLISLVTSWLFQLGEKSTNPQHENEATFLPDQLIIDRKDSSIVLMENGKEHKIGFGECTMSIDELMYKEEDDLVVRETQVNETIYSIRLVINETLEIDLCLVDKNLEELEQLVEKVNQSNHISNEKVTSIETDEIKLKDGIISYSTPFRFVHLAKVLWVLYFLALAAFNIFLLTIDYISTNDLILVSLLSIALFVVNRLTTWSSLQEMARQKAKVEIAFDDETITIQSGERHHSSDQLSRSEFKPFFFHLSLFSKSLEDVCLISNYQYKEFYTRHLWHASDLENYDELAIHFISFKNILRSESKGVNRVIEVGKRIQSMISQEVSIEETYTLNLPLKFISPFQNLRVFYWFNKEMNA